MWRGLMNSLTTSSPPPLLCHGKLSIYQMKTVAGKPLWLKRMPDEMTLKYSRQRSATGRVVNIEAKLGRSSSIIKDTVVPDPDFRIPIVLLGAAAGLVYTDSLLSAVPLGLLGLLLLFQTTRVRFVFDEEALEVKIGGQLQESGENFFVGGRNRWKYSSFVNWEFWWPNFPVLVYFKETQTKPQGQVHFFPIIFNGKQLYDVMIERCGPSQNSGPNSFS